MKIIKISLDFSSNRYTDKELSLKTQFIIERLTDNSHFTDPDPPLTGLQEGLGRYNAALAKMEDANRQDTIEKNARRSELEELLRREASYVQITSGGNAEIIATSGFETNRKKSPSGPLAMVTGLTIKAGPSRGSLEISWDVLGHAHAYELRYTEIPGNGDSSWQNMTATRHKVLIENLVRGKQYAFKVAGIGSDPSRIWCDEVTSFVM